MRNGSRNGAVRPVLRTITRESVRSGRSVHYEISPLEREDEAVWFERDFGVAQLADMDERDRQMRRGGTSAVEETQP